MACSHQLTRKSRVTGAYFEAPILFRRMKLFWKEDNRIRSSIASTGALRGLICSDYRKFSTRTMSLLNASNWV